LRLDRRVDQLTTGGNLDHSVLDVIAAAEKDGWTADLIREANGWNPGNERLAALARSLLPLLETSASAARPAGPLAAVPHIDPDNPPFAVLRQLLTAAFDVPGLRRFCQVHKLFRPVLDGFGPEQGLEGMVHLVLQHADKALLWDELLAGVAEENPYQFERFVSLL
jgi:hypothetical protein